MIYLGILEVVDYENGYRDSYPKGYRNPDCWQSDSEEDPSERKGLLPLKSEINYQRRMKGFVKPKFDYTKIKTVDNHGNTVHLRRRK